VWSLNPFKRGRAIEDAVTKQYQAQGWLALDDLTRAKNWPLVDFQRGNTLVSLKSVNTGGKTWMTRMEAHIEDLGTRGATVGGNPANMVLDLRVQPGGSAAAQSLVDYGTQYGVTVRILEFP
jgi:filamentous hemagglutinin